MTATPAGGLSERFALAIDLGTGGPKVGLVSLAGKIAWEEHAHVETHFGEGGSASQDAGEWWRLISDAARRAIASEVVKPEAIVAVGITGQWASTVPVDSDGEPVGECVMWMDSRGRPYSSKVIGGPVAGYAPRAALRWIRRTGGAPSTHGADPIGHMLYLQHAEPDVANAASWYLEPVDYLAMRFTGIPSASHASMTAAWLTNNRRLDVLAYDQTLVGMAGIDGTKLPPLRATGSVIGEVQSRVAAELGLPGGVQVVTGIPDLHSALCGSGGVEDFVAHMAISTSAWIGAPVPFKKTDAIHQVVSVPGISPDRYVIANSQETGGLCLHWLRDALGGNGGSAGEPIDFDTLTELAGTSVPGAGEVLFTPWLNGERSPIDDRLARGGFHNLSISTSRADLVRSVLEGVAYNSRWLLDAVERFVKRRLDPIRIIGGGAQSDLWCQIHADILDRTLQRVPEPLHANLRGAAIFAGIGLGEVQRSQVAELVSIERTFTPQAANRATYDRLFAEFPKLYKQQRGMFNRLNRTASR